MGMRELQDATVASNLWNMVQLIICRAFLESFFGQNCQQ